MSLPSLLIVDDERDLASVLTEMMTKLGFRAQFVTSVEDASTQLEKTAFDLVLSDVRMPIADGIELIERLSDGRYPNVQVALMSGFLDISLPEALDRGAVALFQKPLKFDQLVSSLKRQLLPPAERWRAGDSGPGMRLQMELPALPEARAKNAFELGRGGFFVAGSGFGLKPGESVAFDLAIGGGDRLAGTGQIIWNRDVARAVYGAGCGVQITSLDAASVATFSKLLGPGFVKPVVPLGIPAQYR